MLANISIQKHETNAELRLQTVRDIRSQYGSHFVLVAFGSGLRSFSHQIKWLSGHRGVTNNLILQHEIPPTSLISKLCHANTGQDAATWRQQLTSAQTLLLLNPMCHSVRNSAQRRQQTSKCFVLLRLHRKGKSEDASVKCEQIKQVGWTTKCRQGSQKCGTHPKKSDWYITSCWSLACCVLAWSFFPLPGVCLILFPVLWCALFQWNLAC